MIDTRPSAHRASKELVNREAGRRARRSPLCCRARYARCFGRILHDRTADKIAEVISQVPNAAPRSSRSTWRAGCTCCTPAGRRLAAQAGDAHRQRGLPGGDGTQQGMR